MEDLQQIARSDVSTLRAKQNAGVGQEPRRSQGGASANDTVCGEQAIGGRQASQALDPAVLAEIAELQEAGEPDVLAQTIRNYLACAGPRFAALTRAWRDEDRASLASSAHAVTGSVGVFGAWKLVELLRGLERDALTSDPGQLAALMSELVAEYQKMEVELKDLMLQREAVPVNT